MIVLFSLGGPSFTPAQIPETAPCRSLVAIGRIFTDGSPVEVFHHGTGRLIPEDDTTAAEFGVMDGHVLLVVRPGAPVEVLRLIAGNLVRERLLTGFEESLGDLDSDVEEWIASGADAIEPFLEEHEQRPVVWVLKFFGPRYLKGFLRTRRLLISTTAGFTWGDAVYVTPLATPCSTMIYGRAGVMGYIERAAMKKVYRADAPRGRDLYQRWIRFQPGAYRLLTTTVHSQLANRILRNRFRRRFGIDVVVFEPDQKNRDYVRPTSDRWLALSDWHNLAAAGTQGSAFSNAVRECRWVAIVGDEFEPTGRQVTFRNYFGEQSHQVMGSASRANPSQLALDLRSAYAAGATTPNVVSVATD